MLKTLFVVTYAKRYSKILLNKKYDDSNKWLHITGLYSSNFPQCQAGTVGRHVYFVLRFNNKTCIIICVVLNGKTIFIFYSVEILQKDKGNDNNLSSNEKKNNKKYINIKQNFIQSLWTWIHIRRYK